MKNKKLILFDLDGVILNSKDNMQLCWQAVQNKFSITTPFEDYFKNIGRPFSEIMAILGHTDQAVEIEAIYKETSVNNLDTLNFYKRVPETLASLQQQGFKLGIVTSKDEKRTHLILGQLETVFEVIQTPNTQYRGKPAPDHLLAAMAITNTDPAETVYIGDMEVDYFAATRAAVDYFHAGWGYSDGYASNIITLESIADIMDHLEKE